MTVEIQKAVNGQKTCVRFRVPCMYNDTITCHGCNVYGGNVDLPVLFRGVS